MSEHDSVDREMIIDTHSHVIATDTKKYPLKPLFGKQSTGRRSIRSTIRTWCRRQAAGVDKAVLVQASSAYAFDNTYVADRSRRIPSASPACSPVDVVAPDAVRR